VGKGLKLIFRRIGGRVVPIQIATAKSKTAVGAQLTRIAQKMKVRELRKMDKVIESEFGFTLDPLEAGFIDRNGKLIDLSGKKFGGSGGDRVVDHREVADLFPSGVKDRTDNLFRFMKKMRAVRMSDHGGIFNADMVVNPNKKQEVMLRALTKKSKIIYGDRTNVRSSTVRSGEYKNAVDMINDLFKRKKRK
jgi:hypothetical protein